MRVTVFAPDDLQLVKGGPSERRDYLDDLLVAVAPRYEAVRADYERVLRQRNALLKRRLRRDDDDETTLDVFDAQLVAPAPSSCAGRLPAARAARAAGRRRPTTTSAGRGRRGRRRVRGRVGARRVSSRRRAARRRARSALLWRARRRPELDRGVTLVGPAPRRVAAARSAASTSRTHASQGEQRTLALALRLGGHRLCDRGHRQRAGAAPRRRVQRARRAPRRRRWSRTSRPGRRCSRPRATVPDGSCTPSTCCASTPAWSAVPHGAGSRDRRPRQARPRRTPSLAACHAATSPRDDGITSSSATRSRRRDELGLPARLRSTLRGRWPEIVGADVAEHAAARRGARRRRSRSPPTARSGRRSCGTSRPTIVERVDARWSASDAGPRRSGRGLAAARREPSDRARPTPVRGAVWYTG